MAIKKRPWIARHLITHHHVIADRLVRVALGVLAAILVVGFFVTRWQAAQIKVVTTITGADTAPVRGSKDFVVSVANSGANVRGGAQLAIKGSPGITIETVDDAIYPSDGIFAVGLIQSGAQIRFKVHANMSALGSQEIIAEVRRATTGAMLSQAAHVVVVRKPDPHVGVSARYYSKEGEQLGRGPLPPKVGETTTYYVTMQIPYDEQSWNTIEVSGVLGAHASWTGFVPEGGKDIQYDAITRRVTWRINSWPKVVDEIGRDAGVSFVIGVTPTAGDIGKPAPLLTDVQVKARTREGELFASPLPTVTTDLKDDAKDQGKCLVEP